MIKLSVDNSRLLVRCDGETFRASRHESQLAYWGFPVIAGRKSLRLREVRFFDDAAESRQLPLKHRRINMLFR